MSEVSTFRLYLLRATYLLIVVGLGFVIWPGIIHHTNAWALRYGVQASLLAAVSALAAPSRGGQSICQMPPQCLTHPAARTTRGRQPCTSAEPDASVASYPTQVVSSLFAQRRAPWHERPKRRSAGRREAN